MERPQETGARGAERRSTTALVKRLAYVGGDPCRVPFGYGKTAGNGSTRSGATKYYRARQTPCLCGRNLMGAGLFICAERKRESRFTRPLRGLGMRISGIRNPSSVTFGDSFPPRGEAARHSEPKRHDFQRTAHPRRILLRPSVVETDFALRARGDLRRHKERAGGTG